MAIFTLALIGSALVISAILAVLLVLRIATRQLDSNPSATPLEKAARRLLGVYVRRPGKTCERQKVRS